jgi:peptide/nickel transport system substrate-binding protein
MANTGIIAGQDEQPRYGGTLKVFMPFGEPRSLNPGYLPDDRDTYIVASVFDKLLDYNTDLEYIPGLAKSWEVSPDAKNFTFHLYDNVTWHDGVKFTSADVKWTLENNIENQGTHSERLEDVLDYIETPDNYTVAIYLKKSYAPFLDLLISFYHSPFVILPKHILENEDWETTDFHTNPVGTGPFKFVEYVLGDHVLIEANEDYFKGKPYLDQIYFDMTTEYAGCAAAVETGAGDVYGYPEPYDTIRLSVGREDILVFPPFRSLATTLWHFALNTEREPLNNSMVRQAIAYALDREECTEKAFMGLQDPAEGQYFSGTWAYNPDAAMPEQNLTKAEELLDKAGYPRGQDGTRFTVDLIYTTLEAHFIAQCDIFIENMEAVGIDVHRNTMDPAIHRQKVWIEKDYQISFEGGVAGTDPTVFFEKFIHSTGVANYYNINNATVDGWIDAAKTSGDLEERKEYYYKVQEYLNRTMPRINTVEYKEDILISTDFTGFMGEPDSPAGDDVGWYRFEKVWWKDAPIDGNGDGNGDGEEEPTIFGLPPNIFWTATIVIIVVIVAAGTVIWMTRKKR